MPGGWRLFPAAALLIAALPLTAAPPGQADAALIADLVARLGSDSYVEREAATRALDAAGAAALAALRAAAAGRDPEVARRAATLARAIEKRGETAKLLDPQRLRLQYKDTPLTEAAADFSRRSGVTIKLLDERGKLSDRKITLDTGTVAFWEAFAQFCDKGGLTEPSPPPWIPVVRGAPVSSATVVVMGRNFGRGWSDVLRPASKERAPELEVTLGEGKSGQRPTSYAGALRVRACPPDTATPRQKAQEGEVVFALEVASDGRLQWQKAVGLRIEKATDEDGRALAELPGPVKAVDPAADDPSDPLARLVVIRLKPAWDKPSKALQELTGMIVGQVRLPLEALVTVDDVLKSMGRSVPGKHGGAVKVIDAAREADGRVRVKVQVKAVSRGVIEAPTNPLEVPIVVNGRRVEPDEDLLSSLNFALLDDGGKPFRIERAISTGVRAGLAHEYELTYEPAPGQGEAVKFVYSDRRTVLLDVPFALKEVPLP